MQRAGTGGLRQRKGLSLAARFEQAFLREGDVLTFGKVCTLSWRVMQVMCCCCLSTAACFEQAFLRKGDVLTFGKVCTGDLPGCPLSAACSAGCGSLQCHKSLVAAA